MKKISKLLAATLVVTMFSPVTTNIVNGISIVSATENYYKVTISGNYESLNRDLILKSINDMRKEAIEEKIKFGSKVLTNDNCKPLKYLFNAEKIASIRVVENIISTDENTRPNGEKGSSLYDEKYDIFGENNIFNFTGYEYYMNVLEAEKKEYLKKLEGKEHGETKHYENVINPNYTHVGVSSFKADRLSNFSISQIFVNTLFDDDNEIIENYNGKINLSIIGKYINKININGDNIKVGDTKNLIISINPKMNRDLYLDDLYLELDNDYSITSLNDDVASVSLVNGKYEIRGISEGEASIKVILNGIGKTTLKIKIGSKDYKFEKFGEYKKLKDKDGNYIIDKWQILDGKWYKFDSNGYMVTNSWSGNYYLGKDGIMLTNTITPDGYKVLEDGQWDGKDKINSNNSISNISKYTWKSDKVGKWVVLSDGSYPIDKWEKIDNDWYYFDRFGYMTFQRWIGEYYVGKDGKMLTNTVTPDGIMVDKDGKKIIENSNLLNHKNGNWKNDLYGTWYEFNDKTYPRNKWKKIDGLWYYFDKKGYRVTSKWIGDYYLGLNGVMLTNTTTPDGYKVDENGKKVSTTFNVTWKEDKKGKLLIMPDGSYAKRAWIFTKGKWYYFNKQGYMVTNTWIGDYYLGENGVMLTNTTTPDGYEVDENGKWIQDKDDNANKKTKATLVTNSNGKKLRYSNGKYAIDQWVKISGKWYYFDKDGYMVINSWVGDYYLGENGAMLTDTTTPDGYKVDEDGKWIR